MINYATYSYEENEHLYGPGKRLLLFTQGCSIRCKGCVNSHLWNFGEGTDATTAEIVRLCKAEDIEGITLHGGEPLDQAEGLLEIAKSLKAIGKTVILFTGYTYKELSLKSQRALWRISDIVVSGRYDESKRNIYLQFRGSTNQKIYCHEGKYKDYKINDGETVAILRLDQKGNMTRRGFETDELTALLRELKITEIDS
jgi:anaerobic ribonucleoside-triphosphate reductase activating protein